MVRKYTNKLIECVKNGTLSWESIARASLDYMSEDYVKDMAISSELLDEDENEDEED